jgi:PelA/Pel-15E family pectate lyase
MTRRIVRSVPAVVCLCLTAVAVAAENPPRTRTDSKGQVPLLRQAKAWYGSDEAVRVAGNVLLWQRDSGGWAKNVGMGGVLDEKAVAALRKAKSRTDSTLDNGATHTQIRFLARVYTACKAGGRAGERIEAIRAGCLKGIDCLLKAQYANGGWPQYWPKLSGYSRYITFNDGAMIGAMGVLRDVERKRPEFAFVDAARRKKAAAAVSKGVECILNCQIVVAGKRTAWCAQHDEKTLEPRKARSYELPSISGSESVGVVRFLMDIDSPSPRIVESIQSAVAWFDGAKLTGIRLVTKKDPSMPRGSDRVVVTDATAPPLWARFYRIGTNEPIFCSRDGIPRKTLAEISHERRAGYSWLGEYAAGLLKKDYPGWQKKWAPGRDVLKR